MAGCCDPRGCDGVFTSGFARRRARSYRRRGLDGTARRMVDALPPDVVRGATVLEIGGGVGEVHLELLKRGAASATNLELSPAYDRDAAQLLAEAGLTGRVERRLLDIAAEPDDVAAADVVVLHRVVCCYPDHPELLGAAAEHARSRLVFSFPRHNRLTRGFVAVQNQYFRLRGNRFRVFSHPPEEMLAVLAGHGLRLLAEHRGPVWAMAVVGR